jgi:DNA-binding NtrC family response regulator
VRQLENTLERMVVLRSEGQIDVGDLPSKVLKATAAGAYSAWTPKLPADGVDLAKAVEIFENSLIVQALERTTNNKNQAAALLRLNRTTLVEKLKRRNLAPDKKRTRR